MRHLALIIISVLAIGWCHASDHDNYTHSDLFGSMQTGDKGVVLMVHFGTTYDDTRAQTIDAINQKAQSFFDGVEVCEAYTSRIVIRRLKQRGIEKHTPAEMLQILHKQGVTHVLVQSTNIIEGAEMESLRNEVKQMEQLFKDVRVGNPLLYSPEDYEAVIEALQLHIKFQGEVLLVGHGTYTPATASYAMMDYMLKSKGLANYHVGTIEGYPTIADAEAQIKASNNKQVLLVPFMFVAGDHANNDIAVDLKEELEAKGYKIEVLMEGLGQNPGIQNLFAEHARFMSRHKAIDINAKKKHYAAEKD